MAPPRGHPKWGGKKKGTRNKVTRSRDQVVRETFQLGGDVAIPEEIRGLTPLEIMSKVMHARWAAGNAAGALIAAQAGTVVMISPWVLHRHRRLWHDPDAFDPSRFLPDAPPPPRFAFLPFGAGPRGCIGSVFALQETMIVVAAIVREFELEVAPGQAVWPLHRITLRPRGGLSMILRRRSRGAGGARSCRRKAS